MNQEQWDEERRKLVQRMDRSYKERDLSIIALCILSLKSGWNAGKGKDDNEDWDDEWRNVIYIDTPHGQISWHIHPDRVGFLESIPQYNGSWNGSFASREDDWFKLFL